VDELASTLDLSAAQVERLDAHPPEVVMSLDAPAGRSSDDTSRAWHDSFTEMQQHPDLVQQLLDHSVGRRLDDLLAQLRPIEADVLRRRFGLGGQPAQTLREIAAEYGLSRERIRQIEQAALGSLRERLMV
jgi:RNA polymerase primary sigma factor